MQLLCTNFKKKKKCAKVLWITHGQSSPKEELPSSWEVRRKNKNTLSRIQKSVSISINGNTILPVHPVKTLDVILDFLLPIYSKVLTVKMSKHIQNLITLHCYVPYEASIFSLLYYCKSLLISLRCPCSSLVYSHQSGHNESTKILSQTMSILYSKSSTFSLRFKKKNDILICLIAPSLL